jgi:hypothetical protein
MSWITVIVSLASCSRFSGGTGILQLSSVVQSYVILAFAFAVLGKAGDFGSCPKYNHKARAVIFGPFSALNSGRIFGWIIVSLVATVYTLMTARDYIVQVQKKRRKEEGSELTKEGEEAIESPQPVSRPPLPTIAPPETRPWITEEPLQRQVRALYFYTHLPFILLVSRHTTGSQDAWSIHNYCSCSFSSFCFGPFSCSTRSW